MSSEEEGKRMKEALLRAMEQTLTFDPTGETIFRMVHQVMTTPPLSLNTALQQSNGGDVDVRDEDIDDEDISDEDIDHEDSDDEDMADHFEDLDLADDYDDLQAIPRGYDNPCKPNVDDYDGIDYDDDDDDEDDEDDDFKIPLRCLTNFSVALKNLSSQVDNQIIKQRHESRKESMASQVNGDEGKRDDNQVFMTDDYINFDENDAKNDGNIKIPLGMLAHYSRHFEDFRRGINYDLSFQRSIAANERQIRERAQNTSSQSGC